MKKCPKCINEKPISAFTKDKSRKDGLSVYCKYHDKEKNVKYHINYPWKRILRHIRNRCEDINDQDYKDYGGRGIKCLITEEDIKFLMKRDDYYNLKKPTIDRKENNGNYILDNCRFIEMNINRVKDRYKSVLQYDLNGNFLREWKSATKIENELKISQSDISRCCNHKRKTAKGFKWEYKNND